MSKRFLAILAVVVLGLIAIFMFTGKNASAPSSSNSSAKPSNHVRDGGKKGVTLIEYGDFQCSACKRYYPWVQQIEAKYKNNIVFQFRNFPIVSLHPNAFAAARAAEAASLQNKFWGMYDKLYQNQDPNGQTGWVASSTPLTFFKQFAQELGLNLNKFESDYKGSVVNDVINADKNDAEKFGVSGTPTFNLDGKKIETTSIPTLESFYKLIDDAIAAKTKK